MNYELDPSLRRKIETNNRSQNRLPSELARKMHLEQFWSPTMDHEDFPGYYPVKDLVLILPDTNSKVLRKLSREIGRLVYELATAGNLDAAKQIVYEPFLLDTYSSLVAKAIALEIKAKLPDPKTQKGEITLWSLSRSSLKRSELETELDSLNTNEANWRANWSQQLKQLEIT